MERVGKIGENGNRKEWKEWEMIERSEGMGKKLREWVNGWTW